MLGLQGLQGQVGRLLPSQGLLVRRGIPVLLAQLDRQELQEPLVLQAHQVFKGLSDLPDQVAVQGTSVQPDQRETLEQ